MKIFKSYFYIMVSVILVLVFLYGCSEDMSSSDSSDPAKVEGRVTNDDGYTFGKTSTGVNGATVTLVRIELDGSLTTVSDSSVQTNANGEYTIQTNLDNEEGLVVLAEKDTVTLMARVSAEVKKGKTVKCQPHNKESTIEVDIYRKNIQRNKQDEVSYADVSAYINAETAIELETEGNKEVEVAAAFEAEAEAHSKFLLDQEFGVTQNEIDNTRVLKNKAEVDLESALFVAADNEAEVKTALDNFYQAIIDTYLDTGIQAKTYAKARKASAKVMLKKLTTLKSSTYFKFEQSAELYQAWATDQACQDQFSLYGASTTELNSVVSAGLDLRSALKSAQNDDQIQAAYTSYGNAISAALQAVVDTHSDEIATLNATINLLGGIKSVLQTEVDLAVNSDTVIDSYLKFFNAVETLVNSTLTSATESEIEIVTETMILVNMNT